MTTPILFADVDLVDGTGAPRRRSDVLVRDGRIAAIEAPGTLASTVADATGRDVRVVTGGPDDVLTPGFLDMHAHSDLRLLTEPAHTPKITQGVTTEVIGQDGLAYAPIDDAALAVLRRQIAGWNGNPPDDLFTWRTVAGYLDRLDQGIAPHAAYLVPQGTLRLMVVGTEQRPATPAEIDAMCALLAEGLAQGAVGMSSGLTYAPSMYADTGELTALCRTLAEHGGYYSPHTRSYGAGALEAYAEMLDLARDTGCALHLTHATMNFEPNRGRAGDFLALVDAALDDGCDVTLDTYPYLPGATTLSAVLPSWAMSGGPDAALARLDDPAERARIAEACEVTGSDGCHGVTVDWATLQLSGVGHDELAPYVGRTVADIAAERDEPAIETFFDLLRRDQLATTILQHVGHEENVRAIMRHRVHTGGSDAILVGARPHPRAWGTFPRYLARYVREEGVLGLEDCVHHLTGRAAARLRLRDRGTVAVGHAADLVLLDAARVTDTAMFDEPAQQATGISHVLVDGVPAVDDGVPTGALAGRALRRDPVTGDTT